MKRISLLSLALLLIAAFTYPPNSLTGRWQKRLKDGAVFGVVFRPDSAFEGFVNGKTTISGTYYVRQDTIALANGGCGLHYYGIYKLSFPTQDSVHSAVIQDTCGWRRRGNDGLGLRRVKPGQTK